MPARARRSVDQRVMSDPSKVTRPPARGQQAHHRLEQRGLAHTVAAHQAEDVALGNRQVDAPEHLRAAVGDVEPLNREASPSRGGAE